MSPQRPPLSFHYFVGPSFYPDGARPMYPTRFLRREIVRCLAVDRSYHPGENARFGRLMGVTVNASKIRRKTHQLSYSHDAVLVLLPSCSEITIVALFVGVSVVAFNVTACCFCGGNGHSARMVTRPNMNRAGGCHPATCILFRNEGNIRSAC